MFCKPKSKQEKAAFQLSSCSKCWPLTWTCALGFAPL